MSGRVPAPAAHTAKLVGSSPTRGTGNVLQGEEKFESLHPSHQKEAVPAEIAGWAV